MQRYIFLIFGFLLLTTSVFYAGSEAEKKSESEPLGISSDSEPEQVIALLLKELDSIKGKPFSTQRQDLYLSLISAYQLTGNYSESLKYVERLEQESELLGPDREVLLKTCFEKAGIFVECSRELEAIELALRGFSLAEKSRHTTEMIQFLNLLGIANSQLGNYENAIKYYLKALELSEKDQDLKSISMILNNLSGINIFLGSFEEGNAYNQRGIEIAKKRNDKNALISLYINSAGIHFEMGEFREQIPPLEEALALCLDLKDKKGEAMVYANLADVYLTLEDYDMCIEYADKAIQIARDLNDEMTVLVARVNHAQAVGKKGDYASAIEILEDVQAAFKEMDRQGDIMDLHEILSNFYEEAGEYQRALGHQKEFKRIHDTIFNQEKQKVISELKEKYESDKKNKAIEILNLKVQKQKLELEKEAGQKNLIIIILVLITIVFIIFYRSYRHLFAFWKKENHIGHYRLIKKIASGGMSNVYEVENIMEKNGPHYALKILRDDLSSDSVQQTRLKREAMMIDSLNHPHIVRVFERGEVKGNYFMVMELLSGKTLAEFIKDRTRLPVESALTIMVQLAGALEQIHRKGIIHRDLKSENVMITQDKDDQICAKLLDFGIARSSHHTRLTETGKFLGTVVYLAPEQLRHQSLGPPTDIFSLGILFYEILAGFNPFSSGSSVLIIRRILEEDPQPLDTLLIELPPGLSALVQGMMCKLPEGRPGIAEIYETLLQCFEQVHARTSCERIH